MTFGLQGTPKWRAPEICDPQDEWSMKAADIYSLGLVLLNIATVLYGADMTEFDAAIDDLAPRTRAEKLRQYQAKLEKLALATQEVDDHRAPTFAPKNIIGLTGRMLASNPTDRPRADEVELELVDLGGVQQIYHGACCRKSSRFVTERLNTRFKVALGERDQLRAENQVLTKKLDVLTAKDETYESRIQNERKIHADNIAKLQDQLVKERRERERLEALLTEMQHGHGRRPPRGGVPRPSGERNVPVSSPASSGLITRPKPQAYAVQQGIPSPSPSPASLQYQRRPSTGPATALAFGARPTYSQTAAAGVFATVTRPVSPPASRRPKAVERLSTDSFGESPSPVSNGLLSGSPTPNSPAGFPMRSRNSGSRLPVRAGSGYNPTRSSTPNFTRDSSLTDSTQLSMTSSTFSRLSKDSDSVLDTNAMPTPPLGSPAAARVTPEKTKPQPQVEEATVVVDSEPVGLGLDLGATVGLKHSITEEQMSAIASASVVSSAITGTMSPLMSGSAVSSPRAAKSELAVLGKVPPLPTAKSWADVARRERR